MKFRGTLGLILVFVALGLYLALIEVPSEKKKDMDAQRAKQVLAFIVEDVQKFDLIQKKETLKVVRAPDSSSWLISEPMAVGGENSVINQLLVVLEEAEITRVVDEAPANLADYGLEDPSLKIVLHFKTSESKTLLLGNPSPVGHSTYLKLADEKRVLLSSIDSSQLTPSLNDIRDKLLLGFVPRDITAVDLKYKDKRQSFVQQGEVWKLEAPVAALGDADEISNFLNGIRRERIEAFYAETQEEAASLGLTEPFIEVTLKAGKIDKSWTLTIGKPRDDHSYYARRASTENIFTVSERLVETLSRNPLSFMEKSLITFQEENVAEIESRQGDEVAHVVRDPDKVGRWKFKGSQPGDVDSATVNTLLLDLKEARIQQFAPVNDLKLFGLDAPKQSLTVFKQDGSRETLHLGNPDKSQRHYFATRSTDQTIFQLDAATVKKIFRSRKDFKDKKLLKFDPEQVARIGIQTPDRTFELNKRDNQWVLVQPEKIDDIKPFVGKDILWTLNNLEYENKLNEAVSTEKTGLEHPQLTITLKDQDRKELCQIKIGNPLEEQSLLFSRLTGDPALYQIKDRILGEIPATLEQFRKKEN